MVSRTNSPPSVISLLRRYLQIYWLKPFDAVNDAANAWALRQFRWEEPILEVGGGDGVFSFIMHGGEFNLTDDRYDQADPDRSGDIFDVYREGRPPTVKREAGRAYDAGVDLKRSHLLKARETGLYRSLVVSAPEPLPFAAGTFKTVFLYFPHGLKERGSALNYGRTLKEIRRVIHPEGTVLMTAANQTIAKHFVCYPLHRYFERKGWRRLSAYFKKLDAGRYAEITGLGLTLSEWSKLLQEAGFHLADAWAHVSPTAWRIYDVQTRPLLRHLIHWSWFLRRTGLKPIIKGAWVAVWMPMLALFYLIFAKPSRLPVGTEPSRRMLFVFRAVPV